MSRTTLRHWWLWAIWRLTLLGVRAFGSLTGNPPLYLITVGIPFQTRFEAEAFIVYCIRRTCSMIGLKFYQPGLIGFGLAGRG